MNCEYCGTKLEISKYRNACINCGVKLEKLERNLGGLALTRNEVDCMFADCCHRGADVRVVKADAWAQRKIIDFYYDLMQLVNIGGELKPLILQPAGTTVRVDVERDRDKLEFVTDTGVTVGEITNYSHYT